MLTFFLVIKLCPLQVVRDGQSSEDCQTSIPHIKHRADRLSKGNVKCIQVLRADGVVERQGSGVVVQQNSKTPQVGWRLNSHLLAVMSYHPGVVATRDYPGGWVLSNPLVFWCRLVRDPHCKPKPPIQCSRWDFVNTPTLFCGVY